MKNFLFYLLFWPLLAQAGLVEIRSSENKQFGSGWTLEVKQEDGSKKYYLVTAAHVAERPKMQAWNKSTPLEKSSSLVNADADIAVWELTQAVDADFKTSVKDSALSEIQYLGKSNLGLNLGNGQKVLLNAVNADPISIRAHNEKISVHSDVTNTHPIGPAIMPFGYLLHNGDFIAGEEIQTHGIQRSASGEEWESRGRIQGGMSGSPLVVKSKSGAAEPGRLLGLATSYENFKMRSYFAPEEKIRDLIERHLRGERGYTSPTRFEFHGPYSFRNFGSGTIEANFSRAPASSGVRTDGGGIRTDGGGIRTDGGGIRTDGNGIRTDGGNLANHPIDPSHSPFQAGLIYSGKPTIAFSLPEIRNGYSTYRLFYADKDMLDIIRKQSLAPLALGPGEMNFINILADRLDLHKPLPIEIPLRAQLGFRCDGEQKINRQAEFSEGLTISSKKIILQLASCSGEKIVLEISSDGKINQRDFLPLVEAKAMPSGKKYLLDLRRLFFDNPQKLFKENAPEGIAGERLRPGSFQDERELAITLIEQASGRETYISFDRSKIRNPTDNKDSAASESSPTFINPAADVR